MSADIDTPAFNLKAVVHETGLKPDTLRAWERRYGLPSPQRTGGGHRLYSQREIDILKWLVARQRDGLSISRAAELWRRLDAAGEDPSQMSSAQQSVAPHSAALIDGAQISGLAQAWLDAVLAFDGGSAEAILAQAFAVYPAEDVCGQVLQAGLARIGDGWYQGSISVHQEHFASELATRKLEALMVATSPPTRRHRLLVGCPPGEWHTFPPLLLCVLLQRRGWPVTYLGANVPVERIRESVKQTRPMLAIFVAQRLQTASTLRDLSLGMREIDLPLAYGGRVFNQIPALRKYVPGVFVGEDLGQAPGAIERLLADHPTWATTPPIDSVYSLALAHFQERRGRIESTILGRHVKLDMDTSALAEINDHVGGLIVAGLSLGDLGLIDADLTWVQGLMFNRHLPELMLKRFLTEYGAAAGECLDGRGASVVAWLKKAATI